jgi:hypothetical protein
MAQFFIVQLSEIGFIDHLNRGPGKSRVFGRDNIFLAENLLANPYAHRGVARFEKLHLRPANRNSTFGSAAIHYFGESRLSSPIRYRLRRHIEPSRNLCIRALQRAELLKLNQVDPDGLPSCRWSFSAGHGNTPL